MKMRFYLQLTGFSYFFFKIILVDLNTIMPTNYYFILYWTIPLLNFIDCDLSNVLFKQFSIFYFADPQTGELLIYNHSQSYTGNYVCAVSNDVGMEQCKYTLKAYNRKSGWGSEYV